MQGQRGDKSPQITKKEAVSVSFKDGNNSNYEEFGQSNSFGHGMPLLCYGRRRMWDR